MLSLARLLSTQALKTAERPSASSTRLAKPERTLGRVLQMPRQAVRDRLRLVLAYGLTLAQLMLRILESQL